MLMHRKTISYPEVSAIESKISAAFDRCDGRIIWVRKPKCRNIMGIPTQVSRSLNVWYSASTNCYIVAILK